jgi:hypothetical protein
MEEIKSTVYPIGDKKYMINWFDLKTNDKLYYDTIEVIIDLEGGTVSVIKHDVKGDIFERYDGTISPHPLNKR